MSSASGNTTVPMSRPSTTTSRPARTMARSRELIHSRITGTAETAETQPVTPPPDRGVHRLALQVGREARAVRLEHQAAVLRRPEDRLRIQHRERIVAVRPRRAASRIATSVTPR